MIIYVSLRFYESIFPSKAMVVQMNELYLKFLLRYFYMNRFTVN